MQDSGERRKKIYGLLQGKNNKKGTAQYTIKQSVHSILSKQFGLVNTGISEKHHFPVPSCNTELPVQ